MWLFPFFFLSVYTVWFHRTIKRPHTHSHVCIPHTHTHTHTHKEWRWVGGSWGVVGTQKHHTQAMQIEVIQGNKCPLPFEYWEKYQEKNLHHSSHNITSSLSWVKFCHYYMYSTAYFVKQQNNEKLFTERLYIIHVWKTRLYHHWHFVIVLSPSPSHTHTQYVCACVCMHVWIIHTDTYILYTYLS